MTRHLFATMSIFVLCNTIVGETNSAVSAYVACLEDRFSNGESSSSIRASFETNELYTFYEVLPYCYSFSVDTNDLAQSVERYKAKVAFLESIRPHGPVFVSSNTLSMTSDHLLRQEHLLISAINERFAASNYDSYWNNLYPPATQMWSAPVSSVFALTPSQRLAPNERGFAENVLCSHRREFPYNEILNIDNYPVARSGLYAEISTNAQYNADAMFRYCLTEKSDFATNNIAIAEKQVWRNNFVLEIVTHSCNLHTNEANRALDTAYTNRLAILRAHYEAIPEPHLEMTSAELNEWRTRLGNTIDAYINGISPFRSAIGNDL